MKRIYSILLVSHLFFGSSAFVMSWGQSRPQSATSSAPVSLTLEGTIVDAGTRDPVVGALISVKNQSGTASDKQRVGADGTYTLVLRSKEGFHMSIIADGYEPYEKDLAPTSTYTNKITGSMIALDRISTKPASKPVAAAQQPPKSEPTAAPVASSTVSPVAQQATDAGNASAANQRVIPPKTLDAKVSYTPPLVVAPKGKVTQLKALQFVQSKAELLPDAQPALEQLLQFMQQHPAVEIQLAGHTDNQGDFDKNVQLSKERVEVIKEFLVQNGIDPNRITTRGYGPTRPIASNNSEATRKLNRRVEMTVVKAP
ncbi:OmpA family protein [Spirosoma sp. SC4-14]|uniref:OmpA family protein n=1 Tax=Spirosoma sp. SC4-14 TaxID=3128900 RepID=UPI0030CC5C60